MTEDPSLSRREMVERLGAGALGLAAAIPDRDRSRSDVRAALTTPEVRNACEIADAVRRGNGSAVDVMHRCLERIRAANGELNAFVHLDVEGAMATARRIDDQVRRGIDPGPLAGVPVGIKDLDDCAGMPTTQGSLFYKGGPPATVDSPYVTRLREAGAIPVGKTAVPEFGLHSITWSVAWGATRNPWDPTKSPGGSSGGSAAAVASGMVPLATGSDGGGSIRSPAAFTGLVGLKTSHGRIGREAVSDTTVQGCLSLTVRDTARFLDVAAGPTPFDRTSQSRPSVRYEQAIDTLDVAGLKVAWSDDLGYAPTEPECIEVAKAAAERLVRAAKLGWVDRRFEIPNAPAAWIASAAFRLRGNLELDGIWPEKIDQLSPRVRFRAATADQYSVADIARSTRARAEIERRSALFFGEVDLLMTPVTTVVSLPVEGPIPTEIAGRDARSTGAEAHLHFVNMAWLPAVSVPAGLSSQGFPIGLQIVCPRGRDDIALRLAHILEQTTPWPLLAPKYRLA